MLSSQWINQTYVTLDDPAEVAALFRQAAMIIAAQGYNRYSPGERWGLEGPHSVSSAIDAAVALRYQHDDAGVWADISEDLHTRLTGLLYLAGQRRQRTSIYDIADGVLRWEEQETRQAAAVTEVLELAAKAAEVFA